jgi:hypothetical protein
LRRISNITKGAASDSINCRVELETEEAEKNTLLKAYEKLDADIKDAERMLEKVKEDEDAAKENVIKAWSTFESELESKLKWCEERQQQEERMMLELKLELAAWEVHENECAEWWKESGVGEFPWK